MVVLKSPMTVLQKAHRRVIYMVERYAELRNANIVSDCVQLNIVVAKPMENRR